MGELGYARELGDRRGHRLRVRGRGQRDREDEVVPADDEHDDEGGHDPGRRERSDHLAKGLKGRRAVDLRGLLEPHGICRKNADSV